MQQNIVMTKNAPAAIGPYSQGVIAGNLIFVSGQLGIDPVTGQMKSDFKEQANQALLNLKAILEEAGSSLKNVVKTTVFLKDMNQFSAMNEVYQQYFNESFPARSAIEISQLPKQGLVEVEAIACLSK
jgi:2-iminobutanoate/2-iminopropanoate deaminase